MVAPLPVPYCGFASACKGDPPFACQSHLKTKWYHLPNKKLNLVGAGNLLMLSVPYSLSLHHSFFIGLLFTVLLFSL